MFPTANSTIIRNEAGEVLGWDTEYDEGPDPDAFSQYDDEPPTPANTEQCIEWDMHGESGTGSGHVGPNGEDVYRCDHCLGYYFHPNEDYTTDLVAFDPPARPTN